MQQFVDQIIIFHQLHLTNFNSNLALIVVIGVRNYQKFTS